MFTFETKNELDYLILDEPITKGEYVINEFCLNKINSFNKNTIGDFRYLEETDKKSNFYYTRNIINRCNSAISIKTKLKYELSKLYLVIEIENNTNAEIECIKTQTIEKEIDLNTYMSQLIVLYRETSSVNIYNLDIVEDVLTNFKYELFKEAILSNCFISIDCEIKADIEASIFVNSEKKLFQISNRALFTKNYLYLCESIIDSKLASNSIGLSYLIQIKITDNVVISFTQSELIGLDGAYVNYTCYSLDESTILIENNNDKIFSSIKVDNANPLKIPYAKWIDDFKDDFSTNCLYELYLGLTSFNEEKKILDYYKKNKIRNIQTINNDLYFLYQGVN